MDFDTQIKKDYAEFQERVRENVEALMCEPKEVWENRLECQCYNSFAVFCENFPSAQQREELLEGLRQRAIDSNTAVRVLNFLIEEGHLPKLQ